MRGDPIGSVPSGGPWWWEIMGVVHTPPRREMIGQEVEEVVFVENQEDRIQRFQQM
jgi:hypothetical protein